MPTSQDDDEARALLDDLQHALGGEPDMTATSGPGPRDRDRAREDDSGDIVGDKGASRVTRQTPGPGPGPGPGGGGGASGAGGGGRGGSANRSLAPVIAALLAGVLIGGLAAAAFLGGGDDDDGESGDEFAGALDADRYQAVILSNDKVYFGQLESISEDFFRLESAFFLRETREDADAEPVRALLPVNREIHAPDNTMLIRKDEVVLVENLAADSPILTEIKRQKG